jgi:hypothetical protein
MTYATGQVIANGDYNTFATGSSNGVANNAVPNVNTIWGVGNGNKGYGQLSVLSPVTTGTLVTAAQWASMFSKITSSANHQNTSITSLTNPTTGTLVQAIAALSGNINTVYNNVGKVASTSVAASGSAAFSGANNNRWNTSLTFPITVTFTSGDAARYFFNAGGTINFTFQHTPTTTNAKNTSWANLVSACGTTIFGYGTTSNSGATAGGTGSLALPVNIGYWQQTTGAQTIQKQYATGAAPYANTNYIQTTVHSNGHQGSNGDVGSVLTFSITWNDPASPGYGAPTDIVDGLSQVSWFAGMPPTTYLSNTWGTPVIAAGTVTGS